MLFGIWNFFCKLLPHLEILKTLQAFCSRSLRGIYVVLVFKTLLAVWVFNINKCSTYYEISPTLQFLNTCLNTWKIFNYLGISIFRKFHYVFEYLTTSDNDKYSTDLYHRLNLTCGIYICIKIVFTFYLTLCNSCLMFK